MSDEPLTIRSLAIEVDRSEGLRTGLEHAIRTAIRGGRLVPGSAMPSTRAAATDLGCSRATVVAAFEQLQAEGYLLARQGVATVVADVRSARTPHPSPGPRVETPTIRADFRPGEPDGSSFPRQKWLASTRRVLAKLEDDRLGYPDPRGTAELRAVLADYLARSRALEVGARSVRVTAGFASAIGFVGEALTQMGHESIAVEDPALPITRDVLRLTGLEVVPIPVDRDGLDIAALEASKSRAVVVTPGHQYPLGVVMSPDRRAALVDWADRVDGWIVEDDYDGEFRYDRQPIGSLQGIAPERVIYAGTASKALVPGIRLGWLVAPEAFRRPLDAVRHIRATTSSLEQLAFADLIERGEFERHLRKVRATYRQRRQSLADALHPITGIRVPSEQAGLHLTCALPDSIDEAALIEAAAERGVGLVGLHPHWADPIRPTSSGLVLGFTRPPVHRFDYDLSLLVKTLRDLV